MENDSDANQYMISLKYQFKSYLRTKRFLGLILFTTIISIGITALMLHDEYSMLKAGTPLLYFYKYLSGFSADLVVIIGAFFGGDIISTDTGTNAAYYTLVQPVRRSILFVGRFTAALISSFIIVLVYFVVGVGSSFYLYGKVTPVIFESLGILVLFLAAAIAFASLFSGIFKGQSSGIIVSVLLLFIGFPIIDEFVGSIGGIDPLFSLNFAGEIMYLIFEKPYPAVKASGSGFGPGAGAGAFYTFSPTVMQGLGVLIAYIIICGIIAIILYSRRQIEG
ncbi:ABC transporter permease [Ferroplasma acidiphilum]|jgi:ABC-2 type transport system permease protein|uniref:ABC transporter permease n=1 Tax=Ferroplasma acidiphilum TaxID=74969 RepID=A0A7K4FNI5_9ARCH|nr:ABC transporter permease [Ferroplasma acidiphilum]NOL60573.1 ABC transporter permease [Ferroplasma acidiphilum]